MSLQDLYEFWRWTSIVLAIIALTLTLMRTVSLWRYLDVQSRFGFLACNFFCVAIIWGAGELLYKGVPAGSRSVVAAVPLIWLIIAGVIPLAPNRLRAMKKGSGRGD